MRLPTWKMPPCSNPVICRHIHLPGHFCLLQPSVLCSWPEQSLPPGPGAGQPQIRCHCCNPGPHVALHSPRVFHPHQWPCTTKYVIVHNYVFNTPTTSENWKKNAQICNFFYVGIVRTPLDHSYIGLVETPCRHIYSLGHALLLQSSIFNTLPWQPLPPSPGGGQWHTRPHCCKPGPHAVLHACQTVHSHHWPCVTKSMWI